MDANGMVINTNVNAMMMNPAGAPVMIMDGSGQMMMGTENGYILDPNVMMAPPPGMLEPVNGGMMDPGMMAVSEGHIMPMVDVGMMNGGAVIQPEVQVATDMINGNGVEVVDVAPTEVVAAAPAPKADDKPVTYAEAFPPLGAPKAAAPVVSAWGKKPTQAPKKAASQPATKQIKSSKMTKKVRVPFEQRRYKMQNPLEGERERQNDVIQRIIKQSEVDKIEINFNRDSSMDVMVHGREANVQRAMRSITDELMVQEVFRMTIPQEHHRFIIGQGGSELRALQDRTLTKINLQRGEDTIEIRGLGDGIAKARHEIQLISDQQAKRAFERLDIPYKYHPFITGPDNATVQGIESQTQARINVPPQTLMKDDITVAGDKDAVNAAIKLIQDIYKEKERTCQTVSVEVKKTQHRYVIGTRGKGLQDILAETGVSVEVPPASDNTSSIVLRGEPDKLGKALTLVYEKANSMVNAEVDAPKWLHRFLIGRGGQNINKIKEGLDKLSLDFNEEREVVILEGPPPQVKQAEGLLKTAITDLKSNMAFADITVDQKWHRHIIGKQGSNITRIKNDTGTTINIPNDSEKSNTIHIEGSPDGVAAAKEEILNMAAKMDGEKTRDIIIEQRFHKNIIGQKGAGVRVIREKYPDVQISFPNADQKSDIVTLRGKKEQVDACHDHLKKISRDIVDANFRLQVPVLKKFHGNIIGKGGSIITKIKEETGCTIDIPSGSSESNIIVITGYKDKCEVARKNILKIESEMASVVTKEIAVPQNLHVSMIGVGGKLIQSVMNECGDVHIHIPSKEEQSDKITIRGVPEDVEKAEQALKKVAEERLEMSFTSEITAKPEHHRFLIGKGGLNVKQIRESTGARIMFPAAGDEKQDLITIVGKQDAVEKAKQMLQQKVTELNNVIESEVTVPAKHHRHFVLQRGQVCREIGDEFGGVNISFPKEADSTRVIVKGSADCVENAKKRILEIVEELENFIEDSCVISQKHHRAVLGKQGNNVRSITSDLNVNIKFPERKSNDDSVSPTAEEAPPVVNEEATPAPATEDGEAPAATEEETNPADVIVVSGSKEHVEEAIKRLKDLVPVSLEVSIPFANHRFLIGQKGEGIRKLMDEHDVNINVPPAQRESDVITVTGLAQRVSDAIAAIKVRNDAIEGENADRELKKFKITVEVPPEHHSKLIGKKGATIGELRDRHGVNINIPKPDEQSDKITLQGYEANCLAAKEEILSMIKSIEDQYVIDVEIDPAIHARIIGAKGRSVKKTMDTYKVDIKMPRAGDPPNIVRITGSEEGVEDCREYLKVLEDEYMEDAKSRNEERDLYNSYLVDRNSSGSRGGGGGGGKKSSGFVVQDAPWSASPAPNGNFDLDASSAQDFPSLGGGPSGAQSSGSSWGGSWGGR